MQCDKRTYESEKDAAEDLIGLRIRNKRHKFSLYKCTICGNFHITTITKKILKPNRKEKYPYKIEYPIERKDRNKPKTK